MAGIAGIRSNDNEKLNHILEKIKHRGPHGSWTNSDHEISLGCCELNVGEDLNTVAHYKVEGQKTVVLDGRIYNPAKPNMTDAEAVLDIYNKFGTQFAANLDGDFACAICDNGKLTLGRDLAGIKPLYYGHSNGDLCFASEIKGLAGIVDDIKEFPPGYAYSPESGFQKFTWQAIETPDFENEEQAKKIILQLLQEATEKRMKDNAVNGIFLSGGLDSSIIACMVKGIKPDIDAFTVSMEDGQDLPLAKDVAKHLDIKHHIFIFNEKDINDILPQAIYNIETFEESCVHGAIANLLTAKFASSQSNCVLTGEGADEFFGGYTGQFSQAKDQEEIAYLLDRLVNTAYNTGLQRLDRLNAAISIESRTPFLDTRVMDFCLKIPISHKINSLNQTGKWILRQAFDGRLPENVIYQTKRFFAQGSGVAQIMRKIAEKHVSESDLKNHNNVKGNPFLSSFEELYYYRIFKNTFPQPMFDKLAHRWDPFKPDFFRR